jgi:hypothetical protein
VCVLCVIRIVADNQRQHAQGRWQEKKKTGLSETKFEGKKEDLPIIHPCPLNLGGQVREVGPHEDEVLEATVRRTRRRRWTARE